MLFNSYSYLIYFLPAAVVGYFCLGRQAKWAVRWLVLASFVFYSSWNPRYLPVVAVSIGFNFLIARRLNGQTNSNAWLTVGIIGNLGLLGLFKYSDFLLRTLAQLKIMPLVQWHFDLPLGISFFTFTQIAFLVDSKRGRAAASTVDNYALFVTFFPHLLAGPIIHHSEMMPQFASASNKRVLWENVGQGIFLLSVGLIKKVLLADPLIPLVSAGFDQPAVGPIVAWIAALAYTLQIYFDFSGYTDMALGAALLFNIRLPINFNSPYQSLNLREFWHRWHITLSRFLRDYLYFPLGGSHVGDARVFFNLIVTFVLGGLWHGAAWTFVCWGTLHGVGLCCVRAWQKTRYRLPTAVAWSLTFLFVVTTWIFFRSSSVEAAFAMLCSMLGCGAVNATLTNAGEGISRLVTAEPLSAIALMIGIFVIFQRQNSNTLVANFSPTWISAALVTVALVVCFTQFGNVAPFLYFNF